MKQSYELKTTVMKSSEPSWMTNGIRRLIKRRRALFRKHGRNEDWKKLKKKTHESSRNEERHTMKRKRTRFCREATRIKASMNV